MSLRFLFLQDSAQLGHTQVPGVASREWQDGRWFRKGCWEWGEENGKAGIQDEKKTLAEKGVPVAGN